MTSKGALEALDRSLKGIRDSTASMSGVTLLLSGDFWQTLPVIPKGSQADEARACLKSSTLWLQVKTLSLSANMCAHLLGDSTSAAFAEVILTLGEDPPDITAPDNVTLFENQASIIDCNAKGNPTPEVWLENENRKFLSNSILTFNRKNISRVFCSAIAKSEKNGNFRDRKEINILLKYPPQVNFNISKKTNKIIISCTASGGNPANHKYELKQKWGNTTKNTYDIKVLSINPSFSNTGTWECHVSNDDFLVIKSSNYKIPVRPMFSSGSNCPKKRNVSNGETVILKQCFYSHPKSDVKWQKNEESIDSNKYLITDYLQDEFPFKGSCTSLKIEDTKDDVIDTYTLTVENSEGKETVVFTLRYKKKQEIPMEIIIGCTVGIVLLLIIMGLTYIFYKRG
ncbi:uncharacterized protein LOC115230708, partial [Octopus sinensis]|uniref:ATP-dependent DNA helicase n=1 Tax=Octopus sinensis TaxID=2607531 RepID=A0A6P7U5A2_9MOLL